jgi:hypothetical protein
VRSLHSAHKQAPASAPAIVPKVEKEPTPAKPLHVAKQPTPVQSAKQHTKQQPAAEKSKHHRTRGSGRAQPSEQESSSDEESQSTPIKDMKRARQQLDDRTRGRDPLASVLKETQPKPTVSPAEEARAIRNRRNHQQPLARGDKMPAALQQVQVKKRSRELDGLAPFLQSGKTEQSPPKRNKVADTRRQAPSTHAASPAKANPSPAKKRPVVESESSSESEVPSPPRTKGRASTSRSQPIAVVSKGQKKKPVQQESDDESVFSDATDEQTEFEARRQSTASASSSSGRIVPAAAKGLQRLSVRCCDLAE